MLYDALVNLITEESPMHLRVVNQPSGSKIGRRDPQTYIQEKSDRQSRSVAQRR